MYLCPFCAPLSLPFMSVCAPLDGKMAMRSLPDMTVVAVLVWLLLELGEDDDGDGDVDAVVAKDQLLLGRLRLRLGLGTRKTTSFFPFLLSAHMTFFRSCFCLVGLARLSCVRMLTEELITSRKDKTSGNPETAFRAL